MMLSEIPHRFLTERHITRWKIVTPPELPDLENARSNALAAWMAKRNQFIRAHATAILHCFFY